MTDERERRGSKRWIASRVNDKRRYRQEESG